MKNLANCTPREFLAQTFKIKKSVKEWLDATDIMNIRKNKPELVNTVGLPDDEREKALLENKLRIQAKSRKNVNDILDRMLDKNSEKTLEVLALCCFIEPEDVDNHPMSEYLECLGELISDKGVISFFTSLAQLEQTNSGIVSKQ